MDVTFKSKKVARILNSEGNLTREYGPENAQLIKRRMAVPFAASSLDKVPHSRPERRHELTGNRKGEFAVDIRHPYRLVFVPNHNPLPRKADGGLDLEQITAIKVIGVEDYH